MGFMAKLKAFDAYVKPEAHLTRKTTSGAIVSLVGSTASALIGLVTPAVAHLLLARREAGGATPWASPLSGASLVLLAVGAAVLPSHLFCA